MLFFTSVFAATPPDTIKNSFSKKMIDIAQKQGKPVIVFYGADWCPICKVTMASFKSNLPDGYHLEYVDVTKTLKVPEALINLTGVPTVITINTLGNVTHVFVGKADVKEVEKCLTFC